MNLAGHDEPHLPARSTARVFYAATCRQGVSPRAISHRISAPHPSSETPALYSGRYRYRRMRSRGDRRAARPPSRCASRRRTHRTIADADDALAARAVSNGVMCRMLHRLRERARREDEPRAAPHRPRAASRSRASGTSSCRARRSSRRVPRRSTRRSRSRSPDGRRARFPEIREEGSANASSGEQPAAKRRTRSVPVVRCFCGAREGPPDHVRSRFQGFARGRTRRTVEDACPAVRSSSRRFRTRSAR